MVTPAIPKSHIFMLPSLPMSTLDGFTSEQNKSLYLSLHTGESTKQIHNKISAKKDAMVHIPLCFVIMGSTNERNLVISVVA